MTSRVLLTCWPFVGHISPFMAVALELKARGHEVAIYTGETVRAAVEAEGIAVRPFRHIDEPHAYDLVARMDVADPNKRPKVREIAAIFREWFAETIPDQIADLEPIVADWRPDVIVTETAMWGPVVVLWGTTKIPVVMMSTMLSSLIPGPGAPISALGMPPPRTISQKMLGSLVNVVTRIAGQPIRRRIDELRAGQGLAPLGCTVNQFTARLPLYFVGNVPEFDFRRSDLPASVHYVGPLQWRRMAQPTEPGLLESIPTERPWVHVTESTLRYGEPFVLKAAEAGLSDGAYELIMTCGSHRAIETRSESRLSEHVHISKWINHDDLLPRCAAMVSTGGAGTVMAAILAGVPQVVIPTAWDKPDNAVRIAESGAGIRLAPSDCTPERLREAVDRVVRDPTYADNARRIRDLLRAAPGPAGAAALLEELVLTRHSNKAGMDVATLRTG